MSNALHRLEQLRKRFKGRQPFTDAGFHEMAFVARNIDTKMMFGYFEGTLDPADEEEIESVIKVSQMFLGSLIEVGEMIGGKNNE